MGDRVRVAILLGGRSSEHEVSLMSAANVVKAIDKAKYDVVPILITRAGAWRELELQNGVLPDPIPQDGAELCLLPGGNGRLLRLQEGAAPQTLPKIDVLFPVLHGLDGEDGSVQGLAEVARVPLVGCGILGSAVALDKDIAKRLLNQAGIATARSITIDLAEAPSFAEVEASLGLPLFIKPARQGSSVGVSKVKHADAFEAAIAEGFRHDRKLLVEEFILGREIECSVLEDTAGGLFVSRPGEIVAAESHGFYSYDAKYVDAAGALLKVPADLPADVETRVREIAGQAFRAIGCDGMARVDFFVTPDMRILINEVNTIPGFTNISMYPKAMEASGVSYPEVIDRLVAHGLARASR